MAVEFLTLTDLENCIGAQRLLQFLDDAQSGVIDPMDARLLGFMERAEHAYYARMLRSLGRSSCVVLAQNDQVVRGHVAWICCELIAERGTEFTDANGNGPYMTQYERAVREIDLLSKGQQRSVGEQQAGPLANSGGQNTARTLPVFIFAPNLRDGTGGPRGGAGGF